MISNGRSAVTAGAAACSDALSGAGADVRAGGGVTGGVTSVSWAGPVVARAAAAAGGCSAAGAAWAAFFAGVAFSARLAGAFPGAFGSRAFAGAFAAAFFAGALRGGVGGVSPGSEPGSGLRPRGGTPQPASRATDPSGIGSQVGRCRAS